MRWTAIIVVLSLSLLSSGWTSDPGAGAGVGDIDTMIIDAVSRNVPDPSLRPCFVRLLKAIRRTENGRRDYDYYEFGVEDHRAAGIKNQAGWCAAIVMKRWQEWVLIQAETQDGEPFLHYLARRYCPINREVWLSNVVWFLEEDKVETLERSEGI